MRFTFEGFLSVFTAEPNIPVLMILNQNSHGNLETVLTGAVYNRSADKAYILDNIKNRSTHVEVAEDAALLDKLFPQLKEVIKESDINLPPDEFFLMEDVYQLPDTGSWDEGREVDAASLRAKPQVLIHLCASLHEGALIDNMLINSLRRRVSYLRRGDKYIRSRDNSFRVRPRIKKILTVVDSIPGRDRLLEICKPSAHYRLDFYILKESGINLKRLDSGAIEPVGLIPFIIKNQYKPGAILFESHREGLQQNTSTLIEKRSTETSIASKFDWLPTACISDNISAEGLDELIMGLLKEKDEKLKTNSSSKEFEVLPEADLDDQTTERKKTSPENGLDFNIKKLTVLFYSICNYLSFPKEHIRSKLEQHRQYASKASLKFIDEKGLKTIYTEEELDHMTPADRKEAKSLYLKKYSGQVRRIQESIFYETLLIDAQSLAMRAYLQIEGLEGKTRLVMERSRLAAAITVELKKTYSQKQQGELSDEEFVTLFNRDYNKLVKFQLTSFMAQSVGIIPQPALSC